MRPALLLALAACSAPSTTSASHAPIRNTVPASKLPWQAHPTRATAGAAECRLQPSIALGPLAEGQVALAFSAHGGLAAWTTAPGRIAIQRLSHDGASIGAPGQLAALPDETTPKHVVAVGDGFVVLAARWAWRVNDARWWGAHVDAHTIHPPQDLGLADLDILDAQALDDRRVGLIVFAAAIAKAPGKPRLQTLALGNGGAIESTPHATALATDSGWQRAKLGAAIGWRSRTGDGLFDGRRVPATDATPIVPPDAIDARVTNLAQPIPRRPGGTQYEAMARPALVREQAGQTIGAATELEERGHPVGVTGFMTSGTLAWTGTRFVYAYRRDGSAMLLPIDCR